VDRITQSGLRLALWETTGITTVPSYFAALIDEVNGGPPGVGSGCHVESKVAALRAMLEAAQVRLAYISGARDDLGREEYALTALAARTERLRRLMAGMSLGRGIAEANQLRFGDFRAVAEHLLTCLAAAGCSKILAIDLTRPETGIPVMRVVVPGFLSDEGDSHRISTGRSQ
jgi:ribosomal protein S12 methylthiotransferase accessory factor